MLRVLQLLLILPSALGNTVSANRYPTKQRTCTVHAKGNQTDDVPSIQAAFKECNNGGTVVFPEGENYWIAQKFTAEVHDIDVDWRGTWTFSDNLDYWRNNSYFVAFQNHRAGFVFTGSNIRIEGHSTTYTHINGNGDLWYNQEAGTTRVGRPFPFVFWNVSDVSVSNFHIKDPQLWAINIMNGTDMSFTDIKVNATSTEVPYGTNWVGNTDGFDTMDAHNIVLDGLWYQGGDDCIAIKPRSYNITARNITCHGGNGIAIGSLGQYLEDSSVENVVIDNVDIIRYNEDMKNNVYIKTWIGVPVPQDNYESAGQPRGGGWGNVSHIAISNFRSYGADAAIAITQDSGNNGSFPGSSKMLVSDVSITNFTGYLNGKTTEASVSCSQVNPCFDIFFDNINVKNLENGTVNTKGTCKYTASGGVHGLSGC